MSEKRRPVVVAALAVAALLGSGLAAEFDPFTETSAAYEARARWLREAKLGVFLHWNPSSVIGREISWCREAYGREKYDALYKQFKGERFDAREWVSLFHEAGIRYAVVVPKHHDGFCMWDTRTSTYNVMQSPFGRDYVKEMADACRQGGLRFCLYYSVLDWWNPLYSGKAGADLTRYKQEVFKPHMRELLTNYGPVGCIWFDGHWEASWTHADGREMYDYIRRLQPDTLLGNRLDARLRAAQGPVCSWTGSFYDAPDAVGDYQAREVDLGQYYTDKAWDCCFSLCGVNSRWSWFPPMEPRPLAEVVGWLIQCLGRDGSLLLGVGPRADGTIDPASSARLLELGDWLKLNGEAVYGTRGGPYLPGSACVSTRKGRRVYLFVTHWRDNVLHLPPLAANVVATRLLGGGPVEFAAGPADWTLRVPESFHRTPATIVELELDRDALAVPTVALPEPRVLSQGVPVEVSGEWVGREAHLSRKHANDGDFGTIWAGPENSRSGWVQLDLGTPREVSEALVDDGPYHRTQRFNLLAEVDGQWRTLVTGTTLGERRRLTFETVTARRFRLEIVEANEVPVVAEFQLLGLTPTH